MLDRDRLKGVTVHIGRNVLVGVGECPNCPFLVMYNVHSRSCHATGFLDNTSSCI